MGGAIGAGLGGIGGAAYGGVKGMLYDPYVRAQQSAKKKEHHKSASVSLGVPYTLGAQRALEELGLSKTAEPKGQRVEVGSRKGGKSEPMPGKRGHRFNKRVAKLKHEKGVRDPGALAGAIARSKYGPSAGRK